MQPVDIYKIIYQGTMGTGHFISDENSARSYLLREIAEIPANNTIPLFEFVSPDSNMLRVNLARFKSDNGDVEALFRAMLLSAKQFSPSQNALENGLNAVFQLAAHRKIPLAENEWIDFIAKMKSLNYPTPHHSPQYNQLYHPAYRVITRNAASTLN